MTITVKFVNRNLGEDGIRVYRSATEFDSSTLPAVFTELEPGVTEFVDNDVARGDAYYYLFETYRGDDSAFSGLFQGTALPIETGPGPQTLQAGDHRSGFYGEVDPGDLWAGDALATEVSLTAGTGQNSDTPWLKFNLNGKTLFVPKQSYRHTITWDDIDAQGLVDGTTEVTSALGDTYRVRLLTGGDADPATGPGGEWNALFYPIHADDPRSQNWGVGYTDAEINVATGDGRTTWCQETDDDDAGDRVFRGRSSVTYFYTNSSSVDGSAIGWRPCLELVTETP